MNSNDSLNASFWVAIVIRTFGAIDLPGKGKRQIPAPVAYVPVVIAWAVLQLASDLGWTKPAAMFGWLMDIATVVLPLPGDGGVNPVAQKLLNLFQWVAARYGVSVNNTTTSPTIATTPGQAVSE